MRFDKPIYFQRVIPGAYDANTGDYAADTVTEVKQYASVTNTGVETLKLVYGALEQESLTVRLQNHYTEPFDFIRIDEKVYRVDFKRHLRNKCAFVISEVQKNGENNG